MSSERQISLFEPARPPEPSTADAAEEPLADGSAPDNPLSVSALNTAVRELLESSVRPLWIVGEVANWRDGRAMCVAFPWSPRREWRFSPSGRSPYTPPAADTS
jgi:hypothetical protein